MSADSWSRCPLCVANGTHVTGDRNTFREDWEIGLNDPELWGEDEDGKPPCIIINYHGQCSICGLEVKINDRRELVMSAPAKNEPDTAKTESRSWEQIPAGWFVHAPKSTDWYEVTITRAIHSGLQLVTLRALDGKVIEVQRPRGQQVMCCPGKAADTSATDAVFGAFPESSIIEDQAD